jgi:hypothetical protein
MKTGDKVLVTRVWPGELHSFETVLRDEPSIGEVFQVQGANLGVIDGLSHWSDPVKLFVHTEEASWRLEPLKEEE